MIPASGVHHPDRSVVGTAAAVIADTIQNPEIIRHIDDRGDAFTIGPGPDQAIQIDLYKSLAEPALNIFRERIETLVAVRLVHWRLYHRHRPQRDGRMDDPCRIIGDHQKAMRDMKMGIDHPAPGIDMIGGVAARPSTVRLPQERDDRYRLSHRTFSHGNDRVSGGVFLYFLRSSHICLKSSGLFLVSVVVLESATTSRGTRINGYSN